MTTALFLLGYALLLLVHHLQQRSLRRRIDAADALCRRLLKLRDVDVADAHDLAQRVKSNHRLSFSTIGEILVRLKRCEIALGILQGREKALHDKK